jgi:hypothetical protein
MFMQIKENAKTLEAYEADLQRHPNRFNALFGAGLAEENLGNTGKAKFYYQTLVDMSAGNSTRTELIHARSFIKRT